MLDIEDHYILQQWMNTRAFNETNVLVVSFVYNPQDPLLYIYLYFKNSNNPFNLQTGRKENLYLSLCVYFVD